MIKLYIKSRILALKRRLHIFIFREFNPYPEVPKNIYLSPSSIIDSYKNFDQKLKYKKSTLSTYKWKTDSRNKLKELIAYNSKLYCKEVLNKNINYNEGYTRKRI